MGFNHLDIIIYGLTFTHAKNHDKPVHLLETHRRVQDNSNNIYTVMHVNAWCQLYENKKKELEFCPCGPKTHEMLQTKGAHENLSQLQLISHC